jgi:hypothetical protein
MAHTWFVELVVHQHTIFLLHQKGAAYSKRVYKVSPKFGYRDGLQNNLA